MIVLSLLWCQAHRPAGTCFIIISSPEPQRLPCPKLRRRIGASSRGTALERDDSPHCPDSCQTLVIWAPGTHTSNRFEGQESKQNGTSGGSETIMSFFKEGARTACTGEKEVENPTRRSRVDKSSGSREYGLMYHSHPQLRGQSPKAAFSQTSSMYQVSYRFPCLRPIFH